MPHGSRIVLLSALVLTGCHTAERQRDPLLPPKPVINSPTVDPVKKTTPSVPSASTTGRAGTYAPVVQNENFQRPIAESPTPQPGVMPPLGVPTLPGASFPPPAAPVEIAPMSPPGQTGMTVPPTADGSTGDLKVPSMFGTK